VPIRAARVTVDQTVDLVASARDASSHLITNRNATNSVYLGGSNVTDTTGYELKAGESREVYLSGEDQLYAICAAGLSAVLHILKS
jgi:hypothetical protein